MTRILVIAGTLAAATLAWWMDVGMGPSSSVLPL